MNINKRGAFIVFEGCDRTGKTTQSRLLCKLNKTTVLILEFVLTIRVFIKMQRIKCWFSLNKIINSPDSYWKREKLIN